MEWVLGFDKAILDAIQALRTFLGDLLMPWFGVIGDFGAIWIVATILLLIFPQTRRAGVVVAIALVIDVLVVDVFLKPLVARPRPYQVFGDSALLVPPLKDWSFPSGHTASSFAAASALYFARSKFWIPATIVAALIAFSRLYVYVHYPTDVLAGFLLGVLFGFIASRIVNAFWKQPRDPASEARS